VLVVDLTFAATPTSLGRARPDLTPGRPLGAKGAARHTDAAVTLDDQSLRRLVVTEVRAEHLLGIAARRNGRRFCELDDDVRLLVAIRNLEEIRSVAAGSRGWSNGDDALNFPVFHPTHSCTPPLTLRWPNTAQEKWGERCSLKETDDHGEASGQAGRV
jgi:hypothetical protein